MSRITIRRSVPDFEKEQVQSYDMIVETVSATGMPSEIFLFQRGIAPAYSAGEEPNDMFVAIADPVDLEETPTTPQNPVDTNPFYRQDRVELRFRSITDLEETWQYIQYDIAGLVHALNAGVEGGSTEDVTFS